MYAQRIRTMQHHLEFGDPMLRDYRREGRRIVAGGEVFPLSEEGLRREMVHQCYDLRRQLLYLHRAEVVFSVADPDLMARVGEWIERLQEQLELSLQRRQHTASLLRMDDDSGLATDVADQPTASSEAVGKQDAGVPLRSFFWKAGEGCMEGVRDLQRNLWSAKLLAPMNDGGRDTALFIALGVGRYAGVPPIRMTWLGKINQLHCFVEMMVGGGFVDCRGGSKWMTAADLFVPADPSRRYTAKRISDARTINADDERQVRHCLPATLA